MEEAFLRMQWLYGKDAMKKLASSHVAVFGIGGVGGYVVEGLARCGIGALDLIDHDMVSLSNINRQIIATHHTVGRYKVDLAKERIEDINPDCIVRAYRLLYLEDTAEKLAMDQYDYIVDAIDTVSGKLLLAEKAKEADTPIISAMGAGNKVDPKLFEVVDIFETSICPLARVMRRECKKRKIDHLKVVYSKEKPKSIQDIYGEEMSLETANNGRRSVPGSVVFVPSVVGMIIASEVINDLLD